MTKFLLYIIFFISFSCSQETNVYKHKLIKHYVAFNDLMIAYQANADSIDEIDIMYSDLEDIDLNYFTFMYKKDFYGYDFFFVSSFSSSSSSLDHKLALNSEGKIFKLQGFKQNDEITYAGLNEIYSSGDKVNEFIRTYLLTNKSLSSKQYLKLKTNSYKVNNNGLIGECESIEYLNPGRKPIIEKKKWRYQIKENQVKLFELIETDNSLSLDEFKSIKGL